MTIQFYNSKSDARTLNKELIEGVTLEGALRDESSIVSPSIMIQSADVFKYNYCYIPEWRRYYYIYNITSVRTNLYRLDLNTDVLMSFRGDIANFRVIVDKQTLDENKDEYINDGSLIVDNVMFNRVYKYEKGFNDNAVFILTVAG